MTDERHRYCVNCNHLVIDDAEKHPKWNSHIRHTYHVRKIKILLDPSLCHKIVITLSYNETLERFNYLFERCATRLIDGHFKSHPKYRCGSCGMTKPNTKNFPAHVVAHFGVKFYGCRFCVNEFEKRHERYKHEKKHKEVARLLKLGVINHTWDGTTYHCLGCEFDTENTYEMKYHNCTYNKCGICGYHTIVPSNFIRHLDRAIPCIPPSLKKFTCDKCGYNTDLPSNFKRHKSRATSCTIDGRFTLQ